MYLIIQQRSSEYFMSLSLIVCELQHFKVCMCIIKCYQKKEMRGDGKWHHLFKLHSFKYSKTNLKKISFCVFITHVWRERGKKLDYLHTHTDLATCQTLFWVERGHPVNITCDPKVELLPNLFLNISLILEEKNGYIH